MMRLSRGFVAGGVEGARRARERAERTPPRSCGRPGGPSRSLRRPSRLLILLVDGARRTISAPAPRAVGDVRRAACRSQGRRPRWVWLGLPDSCGPGPRARCFDCAEVLDDPPVTSAAWTHMRHQPGATMTSPYSELAAQIRRSCRMRRPYETFLTYPESGGQRWQVTGSDTSVPRPTSCTFASTVWRARSRTAIVVASPAQGWFTDERGGWSYEPAREFLDPRLSCAGVRRRLQPRLARAPLLNAGPGRPP